MTPDQIRFWEKAFREVNQSPEWQEFVAKQNWRPVFMGSAEMAKYLETEYASTKKLISELKLESSASK